MIKHVNHIDRFMNMVYPEPNTGCWLWSGCLTNWGYGQFRMGDGAKCAHRVSYEMFKGEIQKGMYVCHTCDTRICVNPDHLWAGTHRQNIDDMVAKGRRKGSKSPQAKIDHVGAIVIKEAVSLGLNQRIIGEYFKVKAGAISRIGNGKRWAHLKEDLKIKNFQDN